MNLAVFMWTVDGVITVSMLAIVLLLFGGCMAFYGWACLMDWWESRKNQKGKDDK